MFDKTIDSKINYYHRSGTSIIPEQTSLSNLEQLDCLIFETHEYDLYNQLDNDYLKSVGDNGGSLKMIK